MTAIAEHILEEFRHLAPTEKRQVFETIARESSVPSAAQSAQAAKIRSGRIRLDPALANEIALSDVFNPEES